MSSTMCHNQLLHAIRANTIGSGRTLGPMKRRTSVNQNRMEKPAPVNARSSAARFNPTEE